MTVGITAGDDFAWDVDLLDDGRIVAAGVWNARGGAFAVLRLESDGSGRVDVGGWGVDEVERLEHVTVPFGVTDSMRTGHRCAPR